VPALCTLPHAFSQEGEDLILGRVFEGKSDGFYVDVGAHHPTLYSNTYYFYLRGWRGINIDAMPGSMTAFKAGRPRDINLEIAVAENPGKLTYHIFNYPALNTFDPALAKERHGKDIYKIIERREIASIWPRFTKGCAGSLDTPSHAPICTKDAVGCEIVSQHQLNIIDFSFRKRQFSPTTF